MDNPFGPLKRKLRIVEPMTVYVDNEDGWRWRIKGGNGKIIGASSEGFSSKQAALQNLKLLGDKIFEYYKSESETK